MSRTKLEKVLRDIGPAAIAVSGGIDSLTLAAVAILHNSDCRAFHAVSPAVPLRATARVRRLASEYSWKLDAFDAGEFADPDYRRNPLNRCYFCKQNLYAGISARTELPILSGANLDDLSDYRPGLKAASEKSVRHPYLEAEIDKSGVRSLAAEIGLGALSELPAAPCLASRVTTGIRIEAEQLRAIDRVEEAVKALHPVDTVRCRLTRQGCRIEVAPEISASEASALKETAQGVLGPRHTILGIQPYQRGSAFVESGE